MTAYLVSFLVGVVIGGIYHVMGVRSPAPPIIALLGLLGILLGESGLPLVKEKFFPKSSRNSEEKVNESR